MQVVNCVVELRISVALSTARIHQGVRFVQGICSVAGRFCLVAKSSLVNDGHLLTFLWCVHHVFISVLVLFNVSSQACFCRSVFLLGAVWTTLGKTLCGRCFVLRHDLLAHVILLPRPSINRVANL